MTKEELTGYVGKKVYWLVSGGQIDSAVVPPLNKWGCDQFGIGLHLDEKTSKSFSGIVPFEAIQPTPHQAVDSVIRKYQSLIADMENNLGIWRTKLDSLTNLLESVSGKGV